MKQPKTETVVMSLKKILPMLAAVLVMLTTGAKAQQSLGDIVKEYGFDWIAGRWTATTEEGNKIQVVYNWQCDKHLVTINLRWPDYEHRGMLFYAPDKNEVVQIGVDNKGSTWQGTWDVDGDKARVRIEQTKADGQTQRMAIVYSKVDARTMKTDVYAVDETGKLTGEPRATLQYTRKAVKGEKKAADKSRDTSRKKHKTKGAV